MNIKYLNWILEGRTDGEITSKYSLEGTFENSKNKNCCRKLNIEFKHNKNQKEEWLAAIQIVIIDSRFAPKREYDDMNYFYDMFGDCRDLVPDVRDTIEKDLNVFRYYDGKCSDIQKAILEETKLFVISRMEVNSRFMKYDIANLLLEGIFVIIESAICMRPSFVLFERNSFARALFDGLENDKIIECFAKLINDPDISAKEVAKGARTMYIECPPEDD